MSKIDKLSQRMKNNPKNVRFEDIASLLNGLGFKIRSRGSHYTFRKDRNIIMVVKPLTLILFKRPKNRVKQLTTGLT